MPSKKLIVGLLGTIIAVSVVALIPVFMYGFTVNTAEIEMSIGLSSSDSSISTSSDSLYTSSSIELQQTPIYDLSSLNVVANEKTLNAYEYFFSKLDGNVDVSEEGNEGIEVVDILITFDLTTPSNNSLSFSFNPQGLQGQGLKNVMVLLGPDELKGEVGTFHLTITISITVTLPPPLSTPILNLELTPELIEEGFVRDLIRRIQSMRKDLELIYDAEIELHLTKLDEKTKNIVNTYSDLIKEEVLATNLSYTSKKKGFKKDWVIQDPEGKDRRRER